MKVVLVAPQSTRPVVQGGAGARLDPPVGLLQLAAVIRPHADPVIVDCQLGRLTPKETADVVLDQQPDMVGFTVNFITLLQNADEIARRIREAAPDIPLVFGGNYSTFFSADLMQRSWIDAVVLKEADLSFPDMIRRFQESGHLENVSGSVVKIDGEARRVEFTDYAENLDALPFPAYDLLDSRERYLPSLITSRGCPYDCLYCSTKSMWGGWRCRSAQNVLAEIDALMPMFTERRVNLFDDLFTVNKKRVNEFIDGLKARGYPITWGMSARAETVDDDMLERLGESRCRNIFFGFESGSDRILERMDRRYKARDIERLVDKCIASGIIPHASFMIGMPGESRDDVDATFSLLERLNTPFILMNLFTPFAGTPVFADPARYGVTLFDETDGSNGQIDNGAVFHRTEGMSAEEIKDLWIEGCGIVIGRSREREAYEAAHWETPC